MTLAMSSTTPIIPAPPTRRRPSTGRRAVTALKGAGTTLRLLPALTHAPRTVTTGPLALPTEADLQRARALCDQFGGAEAQLALLGDKSLFFDADRAAFLMFRAIGPVWVVMSDPVGPPERWPALESAFRAAAHRAGATPAFYRVGAAASPFFAARGYTLLKLGEEATVPLAAFTTSGSERRELRAHWTRCTKQGARLTLYAAGTFDALLPSLRRISNAWLAERGAREKGFALGAFTEAYVRRFPLALVEVEGEPVAFATLWCSRADSTVEVDLMRHAPTAPRGIMQFLFVELFLAAQREGYAHFSLGMAPLAGVPEDRTLWGRAAAFLRVHAARFYDFRGLYEFKRRFHPDWSPRFLAVPAAAAPAALLGALHLISAGVSATPGGTS